MNRNELKDLSRLRLQEAKILIDNGSSHGAYYLCGYSVECALKACVAKNIKRHEFPDKNVVQKSYTHDLGELVKVAGLDHLLRAHMAASPDFKINWNVVKDWKETSRYQKNSMISATDLYTAINHRGNGVMSWVKKYW